MMMTATMTANDWRSRCVRRRSAITLEDAKGLAPGFILRTTEVNHPLSWHAHHCAFVDLDPDHGRCSRFERCYGGS